MCRIESARVEQVAAEVTAARESWKLAQAVASNAQRRFKTYSNLDEHIRDLEADAFRTSAKSSLAGAAAGGFSAKSALGADRGTRRFLEFHWCLRYNTGNGSDPNRQGAAVV